MFPKLIAYPRIERHANGIGVFHDTQFQFHRIHDFRRVDDVG